MARDPSLYDDFDWKELRRTPATQQVVFAWNGEIYEMVLSDDHAELFDKTMKAFADCARTINMKLPPLPKHLRAEFPSTSQRPPVDDPIPEITAALASSGAKPAVPSFAAAAATPELPAQPDRSKSRNTVEPDRKVPGGGEVPKNFWVTPKNCSAQTAKRFQAMRAAIYAKGGELPTKGGLPAHLHPVAYAWASENPEEVRAVLTRDY